MQPVKILTKRARIAVVGSLLAIESSGCAPRTVSPPEEARFASKSPITKEHAVEAKLVPISPVGKNAPVEGKVAAKPPITKEAAVAIALDHMRATGGLPHKYGINVMEQKASGEWYILITFRHNRPGDHVQIVVNKDGVVTSVNAGA